MKFHLITLFPEACEPYLSASILGRARKAKKIAVSYQTPREFVENRWGKVDERPYAGGPGMVMMAEPIVKAVESVIKKVVSSKQKVARKIKIINFIYKIYNSIFKISPKLIIYQIKAYIVKNLRNLCSRP